MITSDAFRTKVEAYLDRSGMTPTRFGKEAVGDPNFVHDLRAGRMPGLRVVDRVLAFMAAKPPRRRRAA